MWLEWGVYNLDNKNVVRVGDQNWEIVQIIISVIVFSFEIHVHYILYRQFSSPTWKNRPQPSFSQSDLSPSYIKLLQNGSTPSFRAIGVGESKLCISKHHSAHSVHHPFLLGEGELSPQLNFQEGRGLTGTQSLEGGCWEREVNFFSGGCSFHIKNKLKSEIFNNNKKL